MQVRKRVSDLSAGEFVVRVGDRPIGATVVVVREIEAGTKAVGPRGGRYEVTRYGAGRLVAMETSGGTPLVPADAFAVVEAPEEW